MSPIDRREDLRAAIDFVLKNLRHRQLDKAVQPYYQAWLLRLEEADEPCPHLKPAEPDETPGCPTQEWRYRAFLDYELEQHIAAGRLDATLAANLQEENRQRGRKLRPLIHLTTPHAELAEEDEETTSNPEAATESPPGFRFVSLLEAILDPRSLQYLMMLGGGLLVLGLVIWLATQGFFDNPVVVASLLAAGNLAVLGASAFVLTRTRFQLAGRGLALLAFSPVRLSAMR